MSRDPSPDQTAADRLGDDRLVFRAASRASQLTGDKQEATSDAYHRRPPDHPSHDEIGISVGLTPQDAIGRLNKVHGVIRLSVGEIRALRVEGSDRVLDVVLTPTPDNPGHADITGLPYYDPVKRKAELNEANAWAEKLRSISRILPEDQVQNR